ncbi:hypothetical protein V501_04698 [Pseudogymnoascus sp. VKM F-4519 (FW-2642)]|nr:hypothetical protein V501_04698 [Pseudogymnoascus sp. VKM F-4519 (FW-2642)]
MVCGIQRREDAPSLTVVQHAGVGHVHSCEMVYAEVKVDFSARRENVENVDIFVKLGGVVEAAGEEMRNRPSETRA